MGATKTHQYSSAEINSAAIAKALAHPARIRIINLLKESSLIRNTDLIPILDLSKTSVHAHLICMIKANIIEQHFFQNAYLLKLKEDTLISFSKRLEELH
jgi:DNA-binding transcriptional ArsR family regulator